MVDLSSRIGVLGLSPHRRQSLSSSFDYYIDSFTYDIHTQAISAQENGVGEKRDSGGGGWITFHDEGVPT